MGALKIPEGLNPHENGLHWSPRLREQGKKRVTETRSAYYLWYLGRYKVALGLFLLGALVTNIEIPEHQTNPNSTFTEQVMNWFHKVNELYDGTHNEVHHTSSQ